MNYTFLPDKVKEKLKVALAGRIPGIIVRASGDITGQQGEGYVVAEGEDLLLFSRPLGESDFREIRTSLSKGVSDFRIEREAGQSMLNLSFGGRQWQIKGSNFEIRELEPVIRRWRELTGGGQDDTAAASPATATSSTTKSTAAPAALTPMMGLAAAMMHVAMADDKVAPEEDRYIIQICQGKQRLLQDALAYFKVHSYEALLAELSAMLDHDQKLCVLANLLELGMSDGSLRSSEQQLMREFTAAMGLSDDEFETIRQVLLIKNRITVMTSGKTP